MAAALLNVHKGQHTIYERGFLTTHSIFWELSFSASASQVRNQNLSSEH